MNTTNNTTTDDRSGNAAMLVRHAKDTRDNAATSAKSFLQQFIRVTPDFQDPDRAMTADDLRFVIAQMRGTLQVLESLEREAHEAETTIDRLGMLFGDEVREAVW